MWCSDRIVPRRVEAKERGATNWIRAALYVLAVGGMTGCAPETLDGTDVESLAQSYEKLARSMSEEEIQEFDDAMRTIATDTIEMTDILSGATRDPRARLAEEVDGMTVEEVLAQGRKISVRLESGKTN